MTLGIQTNLIDATALKLLAYQITTRRVDAELFRHPFMQGLMAQTEAMGDLLKGANATALKYGTIDLAGATATATAEGSLPAASTITPATLNATPQRQAALFQPTDDEVRRMPLLRILGEVASLRDTAPAQLSPDQLTMLAMVTTLGLGVVQNWIVDAMKAACASLTTVSGTTNTVYTYDAYRAMVKARRRAGARGRGLALMAGTSGWDAIETDILALGGAVQMSALGRKLVDDNSDDTLYTDVYQATDVLVVGGLPTSGVDTQGGLYLPGCLVLHLSNPEPQGSRRVVVQTPMYSIYEIAYAGGSQVGYEVVFWGALTIQQQVAGAQILHRTA